MLPDADILAVIDAPPTPVVLPAPGGRFLALLHYQAHPPIAMLARANVPLAGMRLDPATGRRHRTRAFTGFEVVTVGDGTARAVDLPEGAQVSLPMWAPGGERFAFTTDEPDGTGVWVCDATTAQARQVPGLRVRDVLGADPPLLGGTIGWSRDGRSLFALGAPPASEVSLPEQPVEPRIAETAGKQSQMATFQNLLRTEADEDLFEALATTVPLRVDPVTGETVRLGPPGLYQYIDPSPDGSFLLVGRLRRPFSFRVPYAYFARQTEVWTSDGASVAMIADLPVSDEVPRMGVPAGPRRVSWDERAPARLIWVEALDGGNPVTQAEHRDALLTASASSGWQPERALLVTQRCLGWMNLDASGELLLTEHDRDRRWLTTWRCYLAEPGRNSVLIELAEDDSYGDPGSPLTKLHPDGTRTLVQDGSAIYLAGEGATPDGDRPFLDRRDLESGETTRLFLSGAAAHEAFLCFAEGRRDQIVIWHESQAEPPNLLVVPVGSAGPAGPAAGGPESRRLSDWADPHPALAGMAKEMLITDRGDGVTLSGLLHTPPGYDPQADGPLPLVIWAYPNDFGSAGTAGQVRGSTTRFTRLTASDPAWFAMRGYAVLANATMPVIGEPETKNDTYVEQITAAAAAHVKVLADRGIADPSRVAVAGHSYGAFMTATLLAHTDLFATGIARSGAYNRTLTPFGFQTERRSFWEAPAVYDAVSPFRYADKITAPILLVHGADDANSGTFPIQSERLYQAIGATGGTARLVILPYESHGYLARESVLHVLAEQFAWLKRWLG
jgi:dipeptidyl aminopeptidase/acylaminoacyl peptidase